MLASHKWLMEWSGLDLSPEEVRARFTSAGLEVEGQKAWGEGLGGVVVAEVRGKKPHPQRDKLQLVTVWDGTAEQEVVCGASNVPEPGGLVAFAQLGAALPNGMRIEERKLGGVVSRGMICSEVELDVGSDEEGILILEPASGRSPGTPIAQALELTDTVFEIGLTPNRADCLGHLGLARELCALWERPFAWPKPPSLARLARGEKAFAQPSAAFALTEHLDASAALAVAHTPSAGATVTLHAPERCPRYGAAQVLGVRIAPSPFWLRYLLHKLGLRAINNVVDATNYVLLGFGHPIHGFDLAKLRGRRIEVRLAARGESLQTLDGQTRTLGEDDLLICDAEGPVALAGVMGGGNSEIGADTKDVLIECAYFDPRSVRRTSKRTGLHTDSSHRFERGVDLQAVRPVLAHAAALIAELGGGAVVEEALDVHPRPAAETRVTFRPARARALLGTEVDVARAQRIFEHLGCRVVAQGGDLQVALPSFRPDLSREVDLIEELARVQGYDPIPTELPSLRPSREGTAPEIALARRVREACAALGLTEAVNFAFVSPGDLAKARVPEDAPRLQNPMSEERSVLRTALLPGLLHNLSGAQRHGLLRFSHFELARVFSPRAAGELPHERYQLAFLLWGLRKEWYGEQSRFDFYDAKGLVESLLHVLLGASALTVLDEQLPSAFPCLHPRRSAGVKLGEVALGALGELHPDVLSAFDLTGRPVYAVLELSDLLAVAQEKGPRRVIPLPRFPAATRDLAVVVPETQQAGDVADTLREVASELCESVALFDIYRGAPVPEGHKSLAFHVVYRDPAATLTDKRVDEAHARVTRAAEERFGASVRK